MSNISENILPLTPERWNDFEQLFGESGACGGCWCMWWRLTRKVFEEQKGEPNRKAMKDIVHSGEVPGLLYYKQGLPVGWCSVGPRRQFPRLDRSRLLKPVDEKDVWSVVCFFINRSYRGFGITLGLLEGAIGWTRRQGGKLMEGYPIDPGEARYPATFAYTGLYTTFKKAGFKEVARRSEKRPIMRYVIPGRND